MSRDLLLELDRSVTQRNYALARSEFRATRDGDTLVWDGYASVTEHAYPVYGGPPFGWNETVVHGAFRKTLSESPDVAFLINHDGLTLARTKSGTLNLQEDSRGLRNVARMDARMTIVHDLQIAVERGDIDEESFAFRVTRDEWFDERGETSNEMIGTERRILEVNLDKGDVSAVNYGANPATTGGFRGLDVALAELRTGHLSERGRSYIAELATEIDRATEITPAVVGQHAFVPAPDTGNCLLCGALESDHIDLEDPSEDGTTQMLGAKPLPPALSEQYRKLLELANV